MPVSIVEVKTRKQLREFIYLPEKIHSNHKNWLPNIYVDEWKFFDPAKNHAFSHCLTMLYLAYRDNVLVGRIMGIIHNHYNAVKNEKTGRFGYIECYNDDEVAHLLLSSVEKWAYSFGMDKIIGPYGFSDKDPQGLQISGFEYMPILATAVNFPYMVEQLEKNGYEKDIDCYIHRLNLNQPFPADYNRVMQRFESKNDFEFKEFKSKRELKPYVVPILRLVNEAYKDLYGFVPLTDIEMTEFANRYMDVLNPKLVKAIMKNNEVVAFIIGLQNFTPGVQKSKGHLFPFGVFYILQAMKKTKQMDLMLGAVKPNYQGLGFEILMAMKLIESCHKMGIYTMEIHLVLETNLKMLAELTKVGAERLKTFRVFKKAL